MSTTEPDAVMGVAVSHLSQGDVITVHCNSPDYARYYMGSDTWFMGFMLRMNIHQPVFLTSNDPGK